MLNGFQMVWNAMCYFDLEVWGIQFFNKLQTANTSTNLLCDPLLCDSQNDWHWPLEGQDWIIQVQGCSCLCTWFWLWLWHVWPQKVQHEPCKLSYMSQKKIQNVPNTMWRLLVTVKRLLRKTLWLKTTVLLWLRTSWWGLVWRLILALDLPTWWVPLCLLWVCRSECVWLYVGPNIIGF